MSIIRSVDVIFRWQDDLPPLDHKAVVVIDTLRATTTMATILEQGALAVLPIGDVDQGFALRSQYPNTLLGGERNNVPLPGFDGGNSPFDYPASVVQDHRVVLTTTNGTQAVERVASAPFVALGALVNAQACADWQMQAENQGLIVCAGTEGNLALEDVLAAGALVNYWPETARSDSAQLAYALFDQWRHNLVEGIRRASHAKTLIAQGLERDVEFAASLNIYSRVPIRQKDNWFIAE